MYFSFMNFVFAGLSAFKHMANIFNIVSLTDRVGYFSLFSPTSLNARVIIDPRAYCIKVIDSPSVFLN